MTTAKQDDGVHRLLDIVVEEVSLVDRAANKHRFLIVKRSDPMEEKKTEVEQPLPDGALVEKADNPAGDSAMLEAAVEVLDRLTEIVETLGTLAEGDARLQIGEIAAELRALADRLVESAGAEPAPPLEPASDLAVIIASVRATLEQVGSLIGATKAAPAKAEKRDPAPEVVPPPDDPLPGLAASVAKLVEALKEQGQRLSKLEKGFGLPNSAPAREEGKRSGEEDVGWPMDLNRPFDRENVDKAVSFHDL